MLLEGGHPSVVTLPLAPGIELRAVLPRRINDLRHPTVPAREPGFQEGILGLGQAELDVSVTPQLPSEQCLLGSDLLRCIAGDPLEGRLGLRHECAHTSIELRPHPYDFASLCQNSLTEIRNRLHILERLTGMANHEV